MKKFLVIVLVAILTLGVSAVFGGCNNSKPGEITVLINRTDLKNTTLKRAKEQFDEEFEEQGYTVEFETVSDYEGDVTTRMSGMEYGDVLMVPNSLKSDEWSIYFESLGKVSDLEKIWRFITTKASGGNVYGIPTYGNASGIIYNKKVFLEAGVQSTPTTPSQFLDAMQKIKQHNSSKSGFVAPYYTNFKADWALDQWSFAIPSVAASGNYMNNVLPWDKDAFTENGVLYNTFKLLYDLVNNGYTEASPATTEWERSKVDLVNGNIGAMVAGSWAVTQIQEVAKGKVPGDLNIDPSEIKGNPDDIGYMAFPYSDKDGNLYSQLSADYCIGIAKNSRNKEAAEVFLNWFINDFKYYKECNGIPTKVDNDDYPAALVAFEETGVKFIEELPAIKEGTLAEAEKISTIDIWGSLWKKQFVEEPFNKGKSFEQICTKLNSDWNKGVNSVISKYGQKP